MKSRFIYLFSLLLILISCSKEDSNPNTPEIEYITGEVMFIAMGTSAETGFSIELKIPTEETYFATISDTAFAQEFTIGKNILLKGLLTDNYMNVDKIISVDNDMFNVQGTVTSIENNESGYSATIIGIDDEVYNVLFSISNLGEHYHEFKINDSINITGEIWLLNNQLKVTAKTIL